MSSHREQLEALGRDQAPHYILGVASAACALRTPEDAVKIIRQILNDYSELYETRPCVHESVWADYKEAVNGEAPRQ